MIKIRYPDFLRIIDAVDYMAQMMKSNQIDSWRKYENIRLQLVDPLDQLEEVTPYNEIAVIEACRVPTTKECDW